jgi:oligoribonuclease
MHVFVDIETTGLDYDKDRILEIGVRYLNTDFETVACMDFVVVPRPIMVSRATIGHHRFEAFWAHEIQTDYVREMHTRNGLLDEVLRRGVVIGHADRLLCNWWETNVRVEAGQLPMCGSSVGFDREFLRRYCPQFEALFHYRNLDVSTLKECVRLWRPDIFESLPIPRAAHRAAPDIIDTITELAYYRRELFL